VAQNSEMIRFNILKILCAFC